MDSYFLVHNDIAVQISFIRNERRNLIKTALECKGDSISYELLIHKIQLYKAIEQNMYALKAMVPMLLKERGNKSD